MRSRLLVLLALVVLGALVVAVPATAAAKPAKGKAKCALKKKAKCKKAKIVKQKIGKKSLAGADLSGATIRDTTFTGTNLANVNLAGARLVDVTFKNVDLSGATLKGASLTGVRLERVRATPPRVRACMGLDSATDPLYTYCSTPGLIADGVVIRDTFILGSSLERSSWRGTTFANAMFVTSDLDGARFDGANFGTGNIRGFSYSSLWGASSSAVGADFDDSQGLWLSDTDATNASFVGATREVIKDGSVVTGARGLRGTRVVTVSPATPVTPVPASIHITETGHWRIGNLCVGEASCTYAKAAIGSPFAITIRSATSLTITGTGLACIETAAGGVYTSVCSGSAIAAGTGVFDVTYAASAVETKTVGVSVVDLSTTAVAVDAIRIQTVTSGGAVTATHTCANASTCSTAYPAGAWVRFVFTVSSPSGHYLVLNDAATTTLGPTPITDGTTPAFALNADTTLTATIS